MLKVTINFSLRFLTSVFFLFIYYFIVHTLMFSVGNVENTDVRNLREKLIVNFNI